ncbi:MAG: hypothetical protein V3U79_01375 [Dehalococcoidia bacterium]
MRGEAKGCSLALIFVFGFVSVGSIIVAIVIPGTGPLLTAVATASGDVVPLIKTLPVKITASRGGPDT